MFEIFLAVVVWDRKEMGREKIQIRISCNTFQLDGWLLVLIMIT